MFAFTVYCIILHTASSWNNDTACVPKIYSNLVYLFDIILQIYTFQLFVSSNSWLYLRIVYRKIVWPYVLKSSEYWIRYIIYELKTIQCVNNTLCICGTHSVQCFYTLSEGLGEGREGERMYSQRRWALSCAHLRNDGFFNEDLNILLLLLHIECISRLQ